MPPPPCRATCSQGNTSGRSWMIRILSLPPQTNLHTCWPRAPPPGPGSCPPEPVYGMIVATRLFGLVSAGASSSAASAPRAGVCLTDSLIRPLLTVKQIPWRHASAIVPGSLLSPWPAGCAHCGPHPQLGFRASFACDCRRVGCRHFPQVGGLGTDILRKWESHGRQKKSAKWVRNFGEGIVASAVPRLPGRCCTHRAALMRAHGSPSRPASRRWRLNHRPCKWRCSAGCACRCLFTPIDVARDPDADSGSTLQGITRLPAPA